ncbi:hypothetical protein [Paraburkholderia sediminicola]|uniref:hypothetical protein n=1 Tax=Paraburkholderia sediminicola TaxID=458836 RepID=UPI0038B91D0E
MDEIDVFGGDVRSGTLVPLWLLGLRLQAIGGMPAETPVLTAALDASTADNFVECGADGTLTFGNFETASSVYIRFRYQDIEIYWLVDISDPEVWEALDKWKAVGRVPIQFYAPGSEQKQSKLEIVDMPSDTEPFGPGRCAIGEQPTSFTWDGMIALAESGGLEAETLFDLPTVPFRKVVVNVLVTRRWLTYLNRTDKATNVN